MESDFHEALQDAYDKTLKLAVNIAQSKATLMNSHINGSDLKFVKKIAKDCKDFKDLSEPSPKKTKLLEIPEIPTSLSPSKYMKKIFLPKFSGKNKLNCSLEEGKKFLSGSKAGKPIKYSEIGPNILEKIKSNSPTFSEESSRQLSTEKFMALPHVSMKTGKIKPALELPSFKDYVKSERSKEPKDIAIEKINQCNRHLAEFEKEMNGLEMFMSHNPGVIWNNDKKVLLRLTAFPNHKALIIKAYNDQISRSLLKKKSTFRENRLKGKMVSKTPNPQINDEIFSPEIHKKRDPETVVRQCYSRFADARNKQNKDLISILESLNLTRPVKMKQKAVYIMKDNEKFKDKSYSIQKMNDFKNKIDKEQNRRLLKNEAQAAIYDKLMDFLKKKASQPSDTEINFLEVLREVLEEGWCIDNALLSRLTENAPTSDLRELRPLLDYLNSELEQVQH